MGYPTQSAHVGQAYSVGSVNPGNVAGETPLARQKSIYSLTLEEFQNTLGEPSRSFGSMNMEELLKNIWTAEESQAMVAAMGNAEGSEGGIVKQASLQRQGSYSIRGPLGRKTVDEVWKSVFQQGNSGVSESGQPPKQRELTFGEITLEDFLMKAGAVKEEDSRPNAGQSPFSFGGIAGPNRSGGNGFEGGFFSCPSAFPPSRTLLSSMPVNLSPASLQNAYHNGSTQHHGQPFGQPLVTEVGAVFPNSLKSASTNSLAAAPIGLGGLSSPVGGGIAASLNANVNYGFNNGLSLTVPAFKADSPLSHSSDGTGTSQGNMPLSPLMQSDLNGPFFSRKRLAEGPAEMAVERRQRRMIKNRESAARSRARKQAYTVELENELTQLREENSKLKQKQETAEKKFKQVIATSQENRKEERKLRRTNTVPCCKAGRLPFVIARLPSFS